MLKFFFKTEAGNGQFTLDTSVLPSPPTLPGYPVEYPDAVSNATFNNVFIEKAELEAYLESDLPNGTIIHFGDRYDNFYVGLGFKNIDLVSSLSPLASIYNDNFVSTLPGFFASNVFIGDSEFTITSFRGNLPPVAQNDENFKITPNEPLNENVLTNDSDDDGDELTSELKFNPVEGKLNFNSDGTFTYTHNEIFSGLDYFTYVAKDEYDEVSNTANVIVSIPQPEPLRIKGRYQQVAETSYNVSGDVQVGLLNKTIPFPFNPLITIKNGSLQYDLQTAIQANGVVYSNIGDIAAPLFSGNFSINKGQTTTASLEDTKLNSSTEFQLVGLDIDFTKVALQSEKIALQGTIKLPELLGGTSVDINGDNWLLIAQDGISFTGGQIKVPATSLKFANLFDFESSDLLLNYQKQPEALKIQGKAQVSIPLLRNLKSSADFSSPDKYILIAADQANGVEVDAVGTLTLLENLAIVPGKWELKQTVIDLDTPAGKVSGSAGILFPFGLEVGAKLGFQQVQDGWDLNEVRVAVGTGNLPSLPGIPLVIQKLDASVTGLSDPASKLAATVHSIKITDALSPLPTLTLPWGGSFTGSLVELELSGSIDANRLDANGNLKIAGGLVTGNAHTILNWDQDTLNAGVNIQALGGILTATAGFHANSALNFTMTGAGKLKTPDNDFWKKFKLAGVEIASAVVKVQFTNDGNFSNDFISTGGKIPGVSNVLDLFGVPSGIQVKLNGDTKPLGLKEIEEIAQQAEGSVSSITRLDDANLSSLDASTLSEIAQQAWSLAQSDLQKFSTSSNFTLTLNIAFGSNWDGTVATAIKESWLAGDFSALPKIEIVSASNISNANAAYADSTNTIYIAREFLTENQTNLETISGVLLEEIGHWIDAHINIADSPGDEGAIFSDLVRSKSLTAQQLQLLKAEDDTVSVTLNNTVIQLNLNSFQIAQAGFNVGVNTPWLLLSADWENDIGKPGIQLQAPDGKIYTEADISDTSNIRIVEELSDDTHLIIGVNQPAAGIWNFKLLSNTDPGKVDFAALGGTNAPTVSITSVNQDVNSQAITINYDAFDIDSQAKISFFLDTDRNNFDGLLIAEGISETDSSGSYVLNPEGIEPGDYYIYAVAEDDDSVPTFTYAPYQVRIGQSLPSLSINNINVLEGDNGVTNAVLTVTLSQASTQPISVNYSTSDGSAMPAASFANTGTDYTEKNDTLVFNLGEVTKEITIAIDSDTIVEPDETFTVNLSEATNATIANAQGIVTITNDDSQVSVNSLSWNPNNSTFKTGGMDSTVLLTLNRRNTNLLNEIGIFVVDDEQGTINGVSPGASGYLNLALQRAKTIFSTLNNSPNGFTASPTRTLNLTANNYYRFYLVQNSTTDAVLSGQTPDSRVLLSTGSSLQVSNSSPNNYTLSWEDGSGSQDFTDLIIQAQLTNQSASIGATLQGNPQSEILDFRNLVDKQIRTEFTINREAAFNNYVGFYQIKDTQGTIVDPLTGTSLTPGEASYAQAAVKNRVSGIDLTVANQSTATASSILTGGTLLAPFIIANGQPEQLLDTNPSNDPAVYFTFLGANPDRVDHIRLLGDNIFGFEDLPLGGDFDYNDIIVQASFTLV
ncbi:hypothetical protein BV372_20445 [Nostoc sp. T09]|uniref:DUF4114 domain-containing protein n=1 Tax=Nostoc sp. T09 TaxID=1932621 RepID=UPI000A3CF34C|nr:DUF4114 domain-containing protein [Nostoc sp. T09]OUL31330.1 hypothetical protein BV372_20445 [Nostoc sp. T09]